jgi:hypothetical protein
MQPHRDFVRLPVEFWANVRLLSQQIGYVAKRASRQAATHSIVKVPTTEEIQLALETLGLTTRHVISSSGKPTVLGKQLLAYFEYRADTLNRIVEPCLMNAEQASNLFAQIQQQTRSKITTPLNKQSGEKKKPAYFTGCVNMIIDSELGERPCAYDPRELTRFTHNDQPFRTFSRRIDGAFPTPVNPIAFWEIKEYYYTTTFGSRVADGVYETLLDGMELSEMRTAMASQSLANGNPSQHLLMLDAHFTWWVKGKAYLCRIMDMLHMGYVDEVLFGREIVDRLPRIVAEWKRLFDRRMKQ